MRFSVLAALSLAALAACAAPRVDVIQVGPWFKSRHWKEVEVFSAKEETRKPWGAIAVFHSAHIPGRDAKAIKKHERHARKLAADIGADAVILASEAVNKTDVPLSVAEGAAGHVFLTGLAIKYAENVSTGTTRAR